MLATSRGAKCIPQGHSGTRMHWGGEAPAGLSPSSRAHQTVREAGGVISQEAAVSPITTCSATRAVGCRLGIPRLSPAPRSRPCWGLKRKAGASGSLHMHLAEVLLGSGMRTHGGQPGPRGPPGCSPPSKRPCFWGVPRAASAFWTTQVHQRGALKPCAKEARPCAHMPATQRGALGARHCLGHTCSKKRPSL